MANVQLTVEEKWCVTEGKGSGKAEKERERSREKERERESEEDFSARAQLVSEIRKTIRKKKNKE